MSMSSTRRFYDQLADGYHLMYQDWNAGVDRQGRALAGVLRRLGAGGAGAGPESWDVLDCACGIGTQALGLAAAGHRVTGTDLSPVAVARAAREAAARGLSLRTAAADMRRLPFRPGSFDAVVCADNALAHLLTAEDAHTALTGMRRALRPGGLLLLSLRPYETARRERRPATVPQVSHTPTGRAVTFQLWHWHDDGERYDMELFQLLPDGDDWRVQVRRTTSWALRRDQVGELVAGAGFEGLDWLEPEDTGFFQPLLTASAPARPPAPAPRTGG
ncbi:class I SAM-dependent methyltransferase [Streptomyces sp. URMC 123]|uniref:class I SAM-dependent methyltransferase n=1 Tax=Streptomyces sp. URMC 123 TaxID=3423403 RepID=UPI003F1C15D5